MNVKKITLVSLAIVAALAGCSVAPKAAPMSEAPKPPATMPAMTLRPGDKVDLKFYYAQELNESQQVAPDGTLTLQLVGEVRAAGKTPSQLSSELKDAYASHLKYPNVAVIVRETVQRKVYVAGEVVTPGMVDLPHDMTVLEAIMNRGGFALTTAQTKEVVVMRYVDGQRRGYKVNLQDAIEGGYANDFVLQPQDIVFVPRTTITNVDNFVDQYISKLIPQTGFVFTPFGN
ncbi:MAG TPA: polysaccharide biosynthesis/export family protein [Tepidisphaeraceae bacterium]|jgi:protein involved in polysaccharide export with SLBB domain